MCAVSVCLSVCHAAQLAVYAVCAPVIRCNLCQITLAFFILKIILVLNCSNLTEIEAQIQVGGHSSHAQFSGLSVILWPAPITSFRNKAKNLI